MGLGQSCFSSLPSQEALIIKLNKYHVKKCVSNRVFFVE